MDRRHFLATVVGSIIATGLGCNRGGVPTPTPQQLDQFGDTLITIGTHPILSLHPHLSIVGVIIVGGGALAKIIVAAASTEEAKALRKKLEDLYPAGFPDDVIMWLLLSGAKEPVEQPLTPDDKAKLVEELNGVMPILNVTLQEATASGKQGPATKTLPVR